MASIRQLSVIIRSIASFFCVLFIDELGEQGQCVQSLHLTNKEFCILSVMCFLAVAHDDAVCYQYSDSRLLQSSRGVLVQLPARFRTRVHDYGFGHLMDRSALGCESALLAFNCSAEAAWTPCDTDDGWYYYTFKLGCVHDVPPGMLETCKLDASENHITGRH